MPRRPPGNLFLRSRWDGIDATQFDGHYIINRLTVFSLRASPLDDALGSKQELTSNDLHTVKSDFWRRRLKSSQGARERAGTPPPDNLQPFLTSHQPGPLAMNQAFQAKVIAACKEHIKQNSQNHDYRACVYIGTNYFVKYGTRKDLEPELATQEFIFNHAQQPQTPVPPRIAKILHHFVDEVTMYLVMECINLQVSPPDLAARIQEAIKWLSEVPPPSNPTLGPVGGGRIRHRLFNEFRAPFNIPDVGMLDEYMKKVRPCFIFSSVHHRQHVIWARRMACSRSQPSRGSPVSVSGERLMFTQSDMDDSNFGVDENGRTVLMDFGEVGLLPETFVAHPLSSNQKLHPIAASLGLSGNSNLVSMAAIAHCLGMVSNPKLGTSTCA